MLLVLKIDIYLLWVGLDTSKIRGIHKITDEILHRQATSHKLPIRVKQVENVTGARPQCLTSLTSMKKDFVSVYSLLSKLHVHALSVVFKSIVS